MQMNDVTGNIYRIIEYSYPIYCTYISSCFSKTKTGKIFHTFQVSTDLLLEYILAKVTEEILHFQNSKNLYLEGYYIYTTMALFIKNKCGKISKVHWHEFFGRQHSHQFSSWYVLFHYWYLCNYGHVVHMKPSNYRT
jgi:hypothetical protein